jgi:antitoxin component HigA of HigAB toxin-antitoxin module
VTKKEMLKLDRLETDDQNDMAIAFIDEYLDANDMDNPELEKLSNLVYEFEERTDIMNRKFKI